MEIRDGFGGESCGCGTIIQQALDENLLPERVDEQFFGRWSKAKQDKSCSPMTIESEKAVFYRRMRNSGLADRFPLLDLGLRAPESRQPKEENLPDSFREDLDKIESWKTDPVVDGRPAELRVKPRAARTIRNALKGMWGFATKNLHLNITRLTELFDSPEIVCGYIDLLSHEYGWLATSLHAHLSSLHRLTLTYPPLKEREYPFFTARLRKLRKQRRYRIDDRKDDSCVMYETLLELPRGIRAKRIPHRELTEIDVAWSVHDELFASWSLYLPWRFGNIGGCGIRKPAPINIFTAELPIEMRADPDLPAWVKRSLKKDEHACFLQYIFWKAQCKNKWAVRGVVPRELLSLYDVYTKRYRPLLLDGKPDPGYLFLNRRFKKMQYDDWHNLYICVIAPQWWHVLAIARRLVSELPEVDFDAPGLSPLYSSRENLWFKLARLVLTRPSPERLRTRFRWASEALSDFRAIVQIELPENITTPRRLLRLLNQLDSAEDDGLEYLRDVFKQFLKSIKIETASCVALEEAYNGFFQKAEDHLAANQDIVFRDIQSFRRLFSHPSGVVVSTCHGVKGEEYDTVIAFGLLRGYLPNWSAIIDRPEEIAFERESKLLYVICSRAKKRLHLIAEHGRETRSGNPYATSHRLADVVFDYDENGA